MELVTLSLCSYPKHSTNEQLFCFHTTSKSFNMFIFIINKENWFYRNYLSDQEKGETKMVFLKDFVVFLGSFCLLL